MECSDSEKMCKMVQQLTDQIEHLERRADEVEDERLNMLDKLNTVHDIVVAWDNAKGFVNTLSWLSRAARWIVATGLAVWAIAAFFKTGTWRT